MFRIDTPNNTAVLPTPAALATEGYFQDTDPGGATSFSADWCNMMQEELAAVVAAAPSLTRDKADNTQVLQALSLGAVKSLRSHASDTGSVTTAHTRVVLAATTSRADGGNAAVLGGSSNRASGASTAVVGGDASEASGTGAAVLGGYAGAASGGASAVVGGLRNDTTASSAVAIGCSSEDPFSGKGAIVSGAQSVALASRNVELNDANTVGGGYNAGAVTAGAANQGLSWKIASNGGNAQFGGTVYVGGDVDDTIGTGATVTLDGSTGDISADGEVACATLDVGGSDFTVDADGNVGAADVTASGTLSVSTNVKLADGSNKPIDVHTHTVTGSAFATDTTLPVTITNSLISTTSFIFAAVDAGGHAGKVVIQDIDPGSGSATVNLWNLGADIPTTNDITIRYIVINRV